MKIVFVASIIRNSLCILYVFFCYFFQKWLFTENYFLISAINLATRGPLYTCFVIIDNAANMFKHRLRAYPHRLHGPNHKVNRSKSYKLNLMYWSGYPISIIPFSCSVNCNPLLSFWSITKVLHWMFFTCIFTEEDNSTDEIFQN